LQTKGNSFCVISFLVISFNIHCFLRVPAHNTPYKRLVSLLSAIFFGVLSVMAQNPVVNFTADKIAGCSPLTVTFTDQSTGNPTNWNWEFSNGRLATGPTTTVTFSTPGTYSVKLVVRNATGIGSAEKIDYITVFPAPTAAFTADITTSCVPAKIQFTNQATTPVGTITNWDWDFGDNSTSNAPNPSHTYNAPGFYTVKLKVRSSTTCEATALAVRYIRVVGAIETDFTFTAPGTCTAPFTVNFQNQANGPGTLTYTWNFGNTDPPSNAQNPSTVYNSTGTYTVRLDVVSSLGCSGFKEKTITISGTTTDFIAPALICPGSSVKFQNNSSPAPVSSVWTFDDGTGSGQISPTKIFITPRPYDIKVVNQYAGCKDSITKTVIVAAKPVVDFEADDSTSCKIPFTVKFTDLTAGATTRLWDFGDGGTSTLPNPSHSYTTFGDFTVSLIVTTGTGCIDTFIKKDFIKIRKTVVTIPGTPTGGCIPFSFSPTANIKTVDPVLSYAWDMGEPGAIYTAPTPTHVYNSAGTYNIKLTVTTESGCSETVTVPNGVRTGIPPIVQFSYTPATSCASTPIAFNSTTTMTTPGAFVEWLWKFGDGTTSDLQNPVHVFKDTGALVVTLIVSNNGCQDSAKKTLQLLPPVANFGYKADCNNTLQIQFIDSSLTNPIYGPISYVWKMGDPLNTTILGATPPLFTYLTVGTYNVTLTVTNGPCSYTITKPVIVIREPADFIISKNPVCKDEFFTLSAINSDPTKIKKYTWTIGTNPPLADTTRIAGTTIPASGAYDVTLTIIDTNGCPVTKTLTNFLIVRSPVANFSVTSGGGCFNKAVTFNDLSTPAGSIKEWKWNFGDATPEQTYTAPPFTHTYSLTGGFPVSLTVKDNNGCTDRFTSPANVIITDPKAGFRAPQIYCPLAPLQFTDTSSGGIGLTYEWNFGDNSPISIGPNPLHQYPAGDRDYSVKLKIRDVYGCEDSVTKTNYIAIRSPKPAFDILDTISICPPLQTRFTFRGTDYKSFYWDFGDNSGILNDFKSPSNYYNTIGTFIPKLYLVGPGGCIDSAQARVTVYDPNATTQLNYGPPLAACNSLQVNYNLTTTPGFRFKLFYGDGTIDSSQQKTLTHLYPSPGNYYPYITLYDPLGCEATVYGGSVVNVFGAVPLFGKDKKEFCDNGEVIFTDFTLTNDPIISRSWDFGDNSTPSSDLNTSHRYTVPGTYIVRLTVVTEYPCQNSYQDTVRVYRTPVPVISSKDTICINSRELFQGSLLQSDSITYWKWDFGNRSTSDKQDPYMSFNAAGDYTVKLIAENKIGCFNNTEKKIHVIPLPEASPVTNPLQIIVTGGTNLNMNYTGPITSYNWTPQFKLDCTDCPIPFATPNVTTKYKVLVQDKYGCINTGEITVVVVCNGENFFIPNTFSPNGDGSNDIFYVRGKGLFRIRSLRIFNRLGEVVFEKREFAPNDPSQGWDGKYKANRPKADVYVYQVELYCDGGQIVQFAGNVALIQ
jgi:gliding motility-associated-like protein